MLSSKLILFPFQAGKVSGAARMTAVDRAVARASSAVETVEVATSAAEIAEAVTSAATNAAVETSATVAAANSVVIESTTTIAATENTITSAVEIEVIGAEAIEREGATAVVVRDVITATTLAAATTIGIQVMIPEEDAEIGSSCYAVNLTFTSTPEIIRLSFFRFLRAKFEKC